MGEIKGYKSNGRSLLLWTFFSVIVCGRPYIPGEIGIQGKVFPDEMRPIC
ncbi:hypothetical protein ES703_36064 [subsurface metagenome]